MISTPQQIGPCQAGILQIRKKQHLAVGAATHQNLMEVAQMLAAGIDGVAQLAVPWPRNPTEQGVVDLLGLENVALGQGPTEHTMRLVFRFSQGPVLTIVVPAEDVPRIGDVLKAAFPPKVAT